MNGFDDIFDAQSQNQSQPNRPFDKEAWAEKKQAERKSVYELADSTALSVAGDGNRFRDYLDVQARFDRYSVTNALLILAQMPQATQVKDYNGWKDASAYVKKRPQSISILEPGSEYQREDGSWATSYNVKRVYDVSQTNSRTRAQPNVALDDRFLLKALISHPPVPMQTVDELPNHMGAYYDHAQQVIFVRRGMAAQDIFRSVSKELAHAELAGMDPNYSRENAAFAAYSASYMLCKEHGVNVSGYDFSRLPEQFRSGDAQSIRGALTQLRDAAGNISARMSRALEQTRQSKFKEQER